MLGTVALTPRRLGQYADLAGLDRLDDLRALAAPVRGIRVLNLSLADVASWVTSLLNPSVPLLNDLGLDCEWRVTRAGTESEAAVAALYDGLNGDASGWTPEVRRQWERYAADAASGIEDQYDLVVLHDPQILGVVPLAPPNGRHGSVRWVWNCHHDLAAIDPVVWADLQPYADACAAVIFEDPAFLPPGWSPRLVQIIPPAIDPLGPRNVPMSRETAAMLAREWGIDPARPLIAQISPFGPGADIRGLIEVYDALAEHVPGVQLAIVPTSLRDDQTIRDYFDEIAALANVRPGCIVLPLGSDLGSTEIDAFRHVATIVVQKSLQRGFALWLSEAMWRGLPVVAGYTVGTMAQVVDGVTGYLVGNTEDFSARVAALLADEKLRTRLGDNARRLVGNHLLITRYLADITQLYARLTRTRAEER